MSLLTVRTQFAKISGRYDLVVASTFADNGADFYIQAGQKLIERNMPVKRSVGRYVEALAVGSWFSLFQNCRAVQEVWISTTSEKWRLDFVDFKTLREAYPLPPSATTAGRPLYYCPALIKTEPQATRVLVDQFGSTALQAAIGFGVGQNYNGILFYPPTDVAYELEVIGLFSEKKLTADADTNYWTEEEPQLLVNAACWALELSYRNTEGARDWENAVRTYLMGLDMDLVDEQVATATQMEG